MLLTSARKWVWRTYAGFLIDLGDLFLTELLGKSLELGVGSWRGDIWTCSDPLAPTINAWGDGHRCGYEADRMIREPREWSCEKLCEWREGRSEQEGRLVWGQNGLAWQRLLKGADGWGEVVSGEGGRRAESSAWVRSEAEIAAAVASSVIATQVATTIAADEFSDSSGTGGVTVQGFELRAKRLVTCWQGLAIWIR